MGTKPSVDTCWSCGAQLSPDADWCGLCYAPVRKAADKPGAPEDEERAGSGREPLPEATPVPQVSIWRSGPTSFGIAGRVLVTALIVLAGYALYLVAGKMGEFYGTPGLALVMVMLGVYSIGAILILWGIWRPQRVD